MKLAIWIILFSPVLVYGHGGSLDSYGCHRNRSAQTYHCHQGRLKGQEFSNKTEMIAALEGSEIPPETFTGKVISVIDGDTIDVLWSGRSQRIRLADIDAPEMNQPYGPEAKQYVIDGSLGKIVTVKVVTIGKHGRLVAKIMLPGKSSLNKGLLKAGLAWWYQKYSNDISAGDLEGNARKNKIGLWQNKNPTAPWEFRHNN